MRRYLALMCGAVLTSIALACDRLTSHDATLSDSDNPSDLALDGGDLRLPGQVVYGTSGPLGGIQEGAAVGTAHVTRRCIWIEFGEGGTEATSAYTIVFLDKEYVEYDSQRNEISIYYPVRTNWDSGYGVDPRLARMAKLRDGERVWVAWPNAWSREDMSPETLMLRTEPHPECPDEFWLPGTMRPVHPLDINKRLDLPLVPHPRLYGTGRP